MLEEIKNIKSEKKDLIKFGITIGILLLIIAGMLSWKEKDSFQILLIIGAILCLFSVVIPIILKPIYWIWMIFATILGWVMTRLILTILFYIIITPIGLILRLFGKQFLELRWNRNDKSYWKYRSQNLIEKEKYKKQF
tara:strand:- start:126 stop:539 length:414 start_codon:yes stop_codon:yes gene_type:complete